MSTTNPESAYNYKVVRQFAIMTVVWGIVGMTVGVLIAAQLVWPDLNFGLPWTSFGRLRPLHTNAVIFAFGGCALFATSYYAVQRTCQVRLFSDTLASFTFWGWQLVILLAAISLPLGYTSSKEYAELEWPIDILITVVWVAYAVVFFGIEGKAIQQLQTTAELDGMCRVVGLPDLHPGRGYPVGAAFFSVGRFYPALVGNDIGCGMALWETGLAPGKLSADKLEKRLGNLDLPLDETWSDCIEALDLPAREHWRALGTIGGGNHFAELQQVETVFDQAALHALDLDAGRLQLLVHSGSRGLGQAILQEQVSLHGHAGLLDGSLEASAYLARHADALRFAEGNRQLIARRILERLRCDGLELLDINHNLVAPAQVDGVDGWLHRKGATPADQGVLVIPGSRGDYSSLATLRETLGLAKDASVEQIAAATSQLKKADPSQKPDPAKFVPLEAVTDLQEQIAALTARLNGGELDRLVGAALQDGRLLPSLEQWARDLGGKDIGQLKAYLDKAAPIAALTRLQGRQPEGDTHNLTDAEMEAARLTGISPADYAKAKGA